MRQWKGLPVVSLAGPDAPGAASAVRDHRGSYRRVSFKHLRTKDWAEFDANRPHHPRAAAASPTPSEGTRTSFESEARNAVGGPVALPGNPQTRAMVAEAQKHAERVAPLLTHVAGQRGGKMIGLQYQIKTEGSLARKIATDAKSTGQDPYKAASQINDVLRYTMVFPGPGAAEGDHYTESVKNAMEDLHQAGIDPADRGPGKQSVKIAWKDTENPYQGINNVMQTPDGYKFELQFHTPESFETKEAAHPIYEQARKLDIGDPQREALKQAMDAKFKAIPVPAGVMDLDQAMFSHPR